MLPAADARRGESRDRNQLVTQAVRADAVVNSTLQMLQREAVYNPLSRSVLMHARELEQTSEALPVAV
jgi:hypothetical protein